MKRELREIKDKFGSAFDEPKWDKCPVWGNWLAQDDDGLWFFFAEEPYIVKDEYWLGGWNAYAGKTVPINWRETKEKRPL